MFTLCLVLIAASLVLGGGTRGGFLSDAILQFMAIPILCVALWKLFEVKATRQMKVGLFFCAAIVAIPLVQLIPLPPQFWSALPGREPLVDSFNLLGEQLPWMPVSVSPLETWVSALSLIPPIAIFITTLQLGYHDRRWLIFALLAIGLFSVFLGLIQAAQGLESPWRFYQFTNFEDAVGFFANKNHFAALSYSLILFAAAWLVHSAAGLRLEVGRRTYDTTSIVAMLVAFTLIIALLAGAAIARSRMGLLLTMAALLGALALGVSVRRTQGGSSESPFSAVRLLVIAGMVALVFSAQYALYGVLERFAQDPLQDGRFGFIRNTIEAAVAYMPFGSGLGTFVPVYAMFEKPGDFILDTYANHAHNDFLELWLTTGVLGLPLFGMFLAWVAFRSVDIWRSAPPYGADPFDWTMVRAATIVIALLVVHSIVDYPLRTGAMMAVIAFSCALLIEPPSGAQSRELRWLRQASVRLGLASEITQDGVQSASLDANATAPSSSRHHSEPSLDRALHVEAPPRTHTPALPAQPSVGSSLPAERRWGTNENWPEEWSTPDKATSKDPQDRKP